jgi:acyl-CoA dehydrogenase
MTAAVRALAVVDGSAELALLDATIRRWVEEHLTFDDLLDAYEDPARLRPGPLWTAATELGWIATTVAEQYGGLGLGLVEAVTVCRALGWAVAPGPYLVTMVAAEALRIAGTPEQRARVLEPLTKGELVATVASGRPGHVVARLDDDMTATGELGPVAYAPLAGVLVVPVSAGGTVRLALLARDAPNTAILPRRSLDGTAVYGMVTLRRAPVDVLAGGDEAAYRELLLRGALLTAADLVGVAERALELTVAHAKQREQFGRAIGSFQAVKHPLVDAFLALLMARKGVFAAAAALDAAEPGAARIVAAAKAKSNEAAVAAAAAAIQFHGASGYTWANPAHVLFKRAKRQEFEFGDSAWHEATLAESWLAGVQ